MGSADRGSAGQGTLRSPGRLAELPPFGGPSGGTPPNPRRQRVVVMSEADFPVGARKILKVGGREIGVFRTVAGLFALRNSCPHQAAPLCLGIVTGTTLIPRSLILGIATSPPALS